MKTQNKKSLFGLEAKTRLALEARRLASDPNANEQDLEEVLAKLNREIKNGIDFKKKWKEEGQELEKRREELEIQKQEFTQDEFNLRQTLSTVAKECLELHEENENIGDDMDYVIALECLEAEVEQIQSEIDVLKEGVAPAEEECDL